MSNSVQAGPNEKIETEDSIIVQSDVQVRAVEIMDLLFHAGFASGIIDERERELTDALCLITARDISSTALKGFGIINGTPDRAVIEPAVVSREFEHTDLAERIRLEQENFATKNGFEVQQNGAETQERVIQDHGWSMQS